MGDHRPGLAIVTGAGSGIGRAVANGLAGCGRAVALVDRDGPAAEAAAEAIRATGGLGQAWIGDVSDPDFAPRVTHEAVARFGPPTDLVNCAAIRVPGRVTEIGYDQWRASLAIGLDGVFLFCRAVIPVMAAAGGGSIVNLSSPSAYGRRRVAAYAATKAGVNVLSACLAADHLDEGIRVNVVVPGFTLTGMTQGYPEEKLKVVRAQAPGGHLATPEDIAALVLYLSSNAGASFTGGVFGSLPVPSF